MQITDSIKYVGVNDRQIDLFEGQFRVPDGMAYNSYLILDDKIAVMDSVDSHFGDEWLENIKRALGERKPDFLVVQHMEMDHSANIKRFMDLYADAKIVSSKVAFSMMKNYFGTDFPERQIIAAEGGEVALGRHTLHFIAAPNVHWPEVIFSYESAEKVLFSADAFGKFGANDGADEDWDCEARRYYFGIVGKFGANVQAVLKKASALDIKTIAPLHGPVLSENIAAYIKKYDIWSSYAAESEGTAIFYTSVYGNTKKAACELAEILKAKGDTVSVMDVSREDIFECVEDAFRYSRAVFATTTYNGGVFPAMKDFIGKLTERNFQNRKIAFIENGSWAPMAAKNMAAMFEPCKDITICTHKVTVKIAATEETTKALHALASELLG